MAATGHDSTVQGEEGIIRLLAPLAEGHPGALGLKDDCALITPSPGMQLVLKTDPVAEGVHFLPGEASEDIAWKALAVNVSDLAAKAARPLAYLMALSFPDTPTLDWLTRFVSGLAHAQAAFGCQLVGGDTDRRPGPLTISITVIGEVEQGRMVGRGSARAAEELFVSGTLGDAALGLMLRRTPSLSATWGLLPAECEHLLGRYARPQPRLALREALREHASAAMDISDGLAKDLGRMCSASGCAAHVRLASVPLSEAATKAIAADPSLISRIVAGGDDYEVLASVPAGRAARFTADAEALGVAVARIGDTASGSGVAMESADGRPLSLDATGWDHF